jgi:conjugative relaxase-like TrwC/TraI family protein
MFTMAKIRSGSTYLKNHLTANDYYAEKESVTGIWVGLAAERLGLMERMIGAKDEAFERLRKNRHPLTGRKLTSRLGADRIAFLDFQCSAPKSVSLLAVTFGDERLRQAHHEAVSVAFAELERFAARRVRGGDAAWSEQTAVTGNLCAARFEHDASRALDAQLHTHLVTANATFDTKADKWFALTEREMLSAIRYAGKVYQNELATRVRDAGYEIETTRGPKGMIEGFEISGITAEERARASKRRAQIEKEIAAFRQKHGREPTTREVHAMTTATRAAKLAEITTAKVRQRQREEFSPARQQELEQMIRQARGRGPVARSGKAGAEALLLAQLQLFERASVRPGHELLAEALNQGLGKVSLEEMKARLEEGRNTDCVPLRQGESLLLTPYGTRQGLEQELAAIRFIEETRGTQTRLGPVGFQPDGKLTADQRQVVESILASTDTVCALRGIAGTGKTFALAEVQRGLRELNRTVIACAPTVSAAAELRAAGFTSATSLADVLLHAEAQHGARLRQTTLIVDEAGIASTAQGALLFDLVKKHEARLILVGDSRQHSGVEAGDFLSILERHSRLQTHALTDIRRQTAREYRSAVKTMAQGQAHAGLSAIDRLGWLHEAKGDYIKGAAGHYVRNVMAQRDTLLVAPTWEEINRLTDAVRAGLKAHGLLQQGEAATVAEPLSWTRAQAAKTAGYQPGYWLTLHRAVPELGLASGTTVEVTAVKRAGLQVRDARGREQMVSPRRHADAWTVSTPRRIELAPGDRVLIRQNHRAAGLVNGAVLTLEARQPSGAWRAHDATGGMQEIPADFRAFTHGYAVTSHKAQGRTCDEVIVCAARLDAKAAYVAFSRARQQATGYTPDKAALFAALPDTHQPRMAAVDVWTPERTQHLHWARCVLERMRQMLAPVVPPVELTVELTPPLRLKATATESVKAGRRSRVSHDESCGHTAAPVRHGMRI